MNSFEEAPQVPIHELSRGQRRVLGTLVEKGLTTPDGYPMTLKALTTGCNQKSNRDPVTNYSESQVEDIVEELREIGLATLLQTDGGRADRYRHLVRKRFEWSERQVAIMAELWMRGTQSLGELRQRASRMVPIDSLDDLRDELEDLLAKGDVQSNGSLARRGIEVDHKHYTAGEGPNWTNAPDNDVDDAPRSTASSSRGTDSTSRSDQTAAPSFSMSSASASSTVTTRVDDGRVQQLEERVESLEQEVQELRSAIRELQTQLGI